MEQLELRLPMADVYVIAAGQYMAITPVGQARPMAPADLAAIAALAGNSTTIMVLVGLALLAVARAGIRYAHSTRSTLMSGSPQGAWFHCSQGKTRRRSQPAPAFDCFIPEILPNERIMPAGAIAEY